jgi:hypothetical protein
LAYLLPQTDEAPTAKDELQVTEPRDGFHRQMAETTTLWSQDAAASHYPSGKASFEPRVPQTSRTHLMEKSPILDISVMRSIARYVHDGMLGEESAGDVPAEQVATVNECGQSRHKYLGDATLDTSPFQQIYFGA